MLASSSDGLAADIFFSGELNQKTVYTVGTRYWQLGTGYYFEFEATFTPFDAAA